MKQIAREILTTIQETFAGYGRDNGSMLAAGLAYYTIFAIAPLLVIAVAVAGFFYGDAAVQGQIVASIEGTVGEEAAVIIQNLIRNARESTAGPLAAVLSTGLLFLAASGLFGQLQRALNAIWDIVPAPEASIWTTIYKRLVAFGMVLLLGFFLLVSLAVTTLTAAVEATLMAWIPSIAPLLPWLDVTVVLLLLTLLFAFMFQLLPDARIAWRDVLVGSLVTAVLFTIGRYLISWYLTTTSPSSAYGAAGSLVAVLLFVYYSAQIVLIGAEFMQVYAYRYGSQMRIAGHARQIPSAINGRNGEETAEPSPPPSRVLPPPVLMPVPDESEQARRQTAAGLLGLALGLLVAYWFNRRPTGA